LVPIAIYAAAAFSLENAVGRPVLPTLRRQPVGSGTGDHLASEAGVRDHL
jgi:hypothetical protein